MSNYLKTNMAKVLSLALAVTVAVAFTFVLNTERSFAVTKTPLNSAELTVEIPKCGTHIEKISTWEQEPEPSVKPAEAEPEYYVYIPWWSDEYGEEYYKGTVKGGTPIYLAVTLSLYGTNYYWASDDRSQQESEYTGTLKVNGESADIVSARITEQGQYLSLVLRIMPKHEWDNGKVTKEPTCTEKGVKTFTCPGCTSTKTEDIAALGHDWDAGKVTTKPTATKKGVKTFTCKRCKATKTSSVPATGKKSAAPTLLKMTASGTNAMKLSWNKSKGASGYDIYFSRCNTSKKVFKLKKIKTVKGNKTFNFTVKDLKENKAYKAYVRPFTKKNGKKKYLKKSPLMHAYANGGSVKFTNPDSVKVKKSSATIKAGKSFKIKATVKKLQSGKKLISGKHGAKVRFVSSDKNVATVSKSGKVKAKAEGKCKIYAYAINGSSKAVNVTVK